MIHAMHDDSEIAVFIIALLNLKGVGAKTVTELIASEGAGILGATRLDAEYIESLFKAGGSKAVGKVYRALERSESTWEELTNRAYETLELARDARATVLHPLMASYPFRLLRDPSHPPILYCKGDPNALSQEKAVAIVGTREPTDFGRKMGRRLAQLLAEDGYAVVSGLAVGCDTAGHEGALDASGTTVAILPTPIDSPVYPRQNQSLADRILEGGGALVSEYAPGTRLTGRQLVSNLVARDEWQPGLSDGVVAVETSINGGTRHALNHALKRGVPTAVFDYSMRNTVDFHSDERFGGNVSYLKNGRTVPIFQPETIERFKAMMDGFRREHEPAGDVGAPDAADAQMSLPIG